MLTRKVQFKYHDNANCDRQTSRQGHTSGSGFVVRPIKRHMRLDQSARISLTIFINNRMAYERGIT